MMMMQKRSWPAVVSHSAAEKNRRTRCGGGAQLRCVVHRALNNPRKVWQLKRARIRAVGSLGLTIACRHGVAQLSLFARPPEVCTHDVQLN